MLYILTQADATGMRTNGNAKLRGHENYREHFVHAGQTTAIDLAKADRVGL